MQNRCGDAEGISFNLMPQGATAKSAAAPVHKKDTIRWQEFLVQTLTRGVGILLR